ncbi:zinc-binding alcohol dehydrogenase family protein [Roseobacter sp. HKCCD9010]|uniref:zinc-dependent alcohol dehydrogenase family protein n=1 Tax=unclassified Roseobacter TaxID=196798 RepID=UPI001492694D|nr:MULTISPECIES: zinc-binding alcohol dehydrogenase family protein [unclassified Roseobacter]MBF9049408.1 zinc-binding alcohol dehydrogenase family protein [Rhodobacterales bacterium HKCCD4356]NNV11408.1 zinc-binding alcohol dehydrogenase family protein [Roseobacter sp. HKCCD7357]NNV15592.1 zinc-binding alcohol dehydrogenase family protein [Roseobacter sp. HKCCD8768]NNV25052.1 zinc-binding alcohol dehydrogenase family protein [Roseobacter sp. HKCCD8192]NNV29309.1 zinc-binding alcohol dehydroge
MTLSRAMVLTAPGQPLQMVARPCPEPTAGEVLIKVEACGVCRTDLHVIDGELPSPTLPLVPGHEVVGRVAALGPDAPGDLALGTRVGIPWLAWTCGRCRYCRARQENLCDQARFTGYTANGGYAEHCVADGLYVLPLPAEADPVALAPLLCAGLIGYRTLSFAGDAKRIGIYGFGAAAHIICQIARHRGCKIYAFVRPGDEAAADFARSLGAVWAGPSTAPPPEELDAALIFAPIGDLIPAALKAVRKGGRVVSGGIHMSDIPSFPYRDLWEERSLYSVANLTRQDGLDFFPLAEAAGVKTETTPYPLEDANRALDDLRTGRLQGAAVLVP